ncbi:hypothetical protein DH09_11975 [Bacillaceae bacterium JMAK1]|nr:hypothetical protein DH09_11975 [Bacillaceae bacterium JMAK1]
MRKILKENNRVYRFLAFVFAAFGIFFLIFGVTWVYYGIKVMSLIYFGIFFIIVSIVFQVLKSRSS